MAAKRINKRLLKIIGIFLGILLVLLTAFHFWFVAHAKELLENLVESKSQGKVKMKVKKFRFSYFSKKMELEKAVFYNTDTLSSTTAYRFSVDKINLQVAALWPIIFQQKFLIDSLSLLHPDIVITHLKASEKDDQESKKDFSIPEEMGKVYHSIQDALQVLKVRRFEIEDAKFTLVNRTQPDEKPITITHLFFHLDNLHIDSTQVTGKERFLFGENLVLRSRNQDIMFPDGRHRLSFSRFRINMRKRLVEFDSCTIAASKGDSSAASFKVFFDALLLTNIDFDTLYRHDVIKADSVYCVNPQFKLDVELGKNDDRKKKPPKLDQIIQQLTGNMQLGFVIVNNASFNITTIRNEQPSSYTSDHNNFEMQGFSVDKDAPRPLLVKSFAMAIRNYENFLSDSAYSMQFDSILFSNNRILLSNFRLQQLNGGKIANSFSMPQFELRGLVWDDLVFNRHLQATGATLYRPLIDFTATDTRQKKEKQTIFNVLGRIGRAMQLDELDIVDGQIDLMLKDNTQLHLQNASLSIESDTLFGSRKISSIERSVNHLNFSHGLIKTSDFTLDIEDGHYQGDSANLLAGKIMLSTPSKTISASANNVSMNGITVNDSTGDIGVKSFHWKQADWKMRLPDGKENKTSSAITLENIQGANTTITATIGEISMSTFLKTISLYKLWKRPGKKWQTEDLLVDGNNLNVAGKNAALTIDRYSIANLRSSSLQNIHYSNNINLDSVNIHIPVLTGIPDIQAIIDGSIKLADINILQPVIRVNLTKPFALSNDRETEFPVLDIQKIHIQQPDIYFSQFTKNGTIQLQWNDGMETNDNFLELEGLTTGNGALPAVSLKKIRFNLDHFTFSGAKGKIFNTGKGKIRSELGNIRAAKESFRQWNWSGKIDAFTAQNFLADSLGKNYGQFSLNMAEIANLAISSATIKKPADWLAKSPSFQLQHFTGKFHDINNQFDWYNLNYAEAGKTLSVDSFSFRPALDHDALVASHPFQVDDFRAKTGKIIIDNIDWRTYLKDSVLNIHTIKIQDAVITDLRDLRSPFRAGIIKPMPVQMLKKIPLKLSIDSILLNDAKTTYSELNAKSNETGTILVTRMSVKFFPVRNFDLTEQDSLRIQANGYLMDSIWVRLRVRESYTDSLSGFLMTVRMKPADLRVLNPVLIPLSSVKLQSGYLDTLSMRAAGKEYLAFGEMKMHYHDLKVKFLKKGSETKKSFLSSLITFVANSFVIRNKNTSRMGRVFFIRLRDRSIMNYLVKITMSGVASSIGAKGNQKILRKYKKELRQRNLPPVDYD